MTDDDDEFDHVLENLQRVLKLNAQYENHPYVLKNLQKCVESCLYMEGRCKIFFGRDMEFIGGRSFTKKRKELFQSNVIKTNIHYE